MKIDAILTPGDVLNREKINRNRNAVVVDVLRVCTTIVQALSSGAQKIFPTLTVNEVFEKKKRILESGVPANNIILGGERGGIRVEGFDLGNSPREYTREEVDGKIIIISSTNGTKAIKRSETAACIILGTIRNAGAVAKFLARDGRDVVFYLSGKEGEFSLEDAVGAGMIIKHLSAQTEIQMTDSSNMCMNLYEKYRDDLIGMFKKSVHGQYLISIGFEKDLYLCADENKSGIVPFVDIDGYIMRKE
ncbi:MAG: 2-phosphosulfolactate phosphatase [Candidatus Eremiobacteraeota bacterium]|nr:2-phosphosulfolactate phosphatase [Candidatus Eremiobacteraeota bacterium]